MLLYPFPAQSRPAPPRPTGIAERASFHSHLGRTPKQIAPIPARQSWSKPGEQTTPDTTKSPSPQRASSQRRASEAMPVSDKGPPCRPPSPSNPETQGAPVSPERFRSNSAKPNCEDQRRGNRGARWEQNGLLTRGAAAVCAARYRRVGAAGAQSGRGIRDEDGPPPPRVREPRAYQDDRARSCPSRPPRQP